MILFLIILLVKNINFYLAYSPRQLKNNNLISF